MTPETAILLILAAGVALVLGVYIGRQAQKYQQPDAVAARGLAQALAGLKAAEAAKPDQVAAAQAALATQAQVTAIAAELEKLSPPVKV